MVCAMVVEPGLTAAMLRSRYSLCTFTSTEQARSWSTRIAGLRDLSQAASAATLPPGTPTFNGDWQDGSTWQASGSSARVAATVGKLSTTNPTYGRTEDTLHPGCTTLDTLFRWKQFVQLGVR
jgi:hypothetical protein